MKFFLKRFNNKKGFTLIELIVVIAILAILALIAIPRFAGFTDKAKQATDEQYVSLVANACSVLLADGTIEFASGVTSGTITIDDADGSVAFDDTNDFAASYSADVYLLVNQDTEGFDFYTADVTIELEDDGDYTITYP